MKSLFGGRAGGPLKVRGDVGSIGCTKQDRQTESVEVSRCYLVHIRPTEPIERPALGTTSINSRYPIWYPRIVLAGTLSAH